MAQTTRQNELSSSSFEDWNDFCWEQFHRQNQTAKSTAPQTHFVKCYLTYWQQKDNASEEETARRSYESIILKAQQDARQIIKLAKNHEARILRDAEISALSDRAQFRMRSAFG